MKFDGHEKQKTKIEDDYMKLKDLSQEELMQKLVNEISKQKANGTFNYDGILNAIERMKIYLPKQAYDNIINILEKLK